jgi:glc operon protein GlcG
MSDRITAASLLTLLTMKTHTCLTYADAQCAINRIVEKATEMHQEVAVAVTDAHGELIAFARMDGVPLPSVQIAINKAWTAARTGKPTQEIGEKVRHPERGHDISYYGDSRYVGWGGGIPVLSSGEVVGAVAVSGLSSTEDIDLARLGIETIGT